jgi:hypothetical protein
MTSPTTKSYWCFCGLQNLFGGQRPTLVVLDISVDAYVMMLDSLKPH